jgi:chemotaxis protein MotA
MIVIIGAIVVLGAVLGGFTMAGGHVGALLHPSEFVTIGGATIGALLIMSPKKVLVDLVRGMMQVVKGSPYGKAMCTDLLKFLYSTAMVVRKEGSIALETHISNPKESTLFQAYPRILNNPHLREFLCEALASIVEGKVDIELLTRSLEEEIEVIEREHHAATAALTKTADSLPGFGIVAAVLGIVVTMQAIGGPVDEIGHKVGAALVGTFLGILMAYGFFAPMAGRMEALGEQEVVFLRAASAGVVAMGQEVGPKDVVARARRILGTDNRPTHGELAQLFKEMQGGNQ